MTIEKARLDETAEDLQTVATVEHGEIGAKLTWQLSAYVYPRNLGRVMISQTTYELPEMPQKREPDVSFVAAGRIPAENVRTNARVAPDLAVEIISPSDRIYDLEERVEHYQRAGVRLIWVVYPVRKIVEIYHLERGLVPQIASSDDELDGEDVLSGFKLKVGTLFS